MCDQWRSGWGDQAFPSTARENHHVEGAKIVAHVRGPITNDSPGAIEDAEDPSAINQGS